MQEKRKSVGRSGQAPDIPVAEARGFTAYLLRRKDQRVIASVISFYLGTRQDNHGLHSKLHNSFTVFTQYFYDSIALYV
jgi:hypothetical protein